MRIIVISDTHLNDGISSLPKILIKEVKNSDLCIHAGDFISYRVFEELSKLVKTIGVAGNMDDERVNKALPQKTILNLEGKNIAITHGYGHPQGLINYVKQQFRQEQEKIDIFIFGHSHQPVDKIIGGKIFFNPGSPTDKVFAPYNSYGILEITPSGIKERIEKIG